MVEDQEWGVADLNPEQGEPMLYVSDKLPWDKLEAEDFANDLYPEDGSGDTQIVKVTRMNF